MTSTIKVDTIQTTSGNTVISTDSDTVTIKDTSGTNTAMTINSDGIVATAARPAFNVYKNSSATEALNGTIIFNGVKSNIGSHYDTSTGLFTAPIAGLYQFNFVGFACSSTASNLPANNSVYVTLNNQTTSLNLARSYFQITSSVSYPNMSFSCAVPLAASDQVYITVGGAYVYSDASDIYLTFSGYLVG